MRVCVYWQGAAVKYFPSLLEKTSLSEECSNLRKTRCQLCPATVRDDKSLQAHIARFHPDHLLDDKKSDGIYLGLSSWCR
jgi:hypothetical protein